MGLPADDEHNCFDELVKSRLMAMNNVGRAIARQLWWAIAHPTGFMLDSRLFTAPSVLDNSKNEGRLDCHGAKKSNLYQFAKTR
jgi:hypothetical protein